MKYTFSLRYLAAILLTGSIVNDGFLFSSFPVLTWAKLLFTFSVFFILFAGIKTHKLTGIEVCILIYSLCLIIVSVLFGGGGIGPKFSSVSIALILGLFSFVVIARSGICCKVIIKCYFLWMLASVILGAVQAVFGSYYITDRIFSSTIIPGFFRASGFMSDPNYFGLMCLILYSFSYFDGTSSSRFLRVVAIVGILLSGSRSAVLVLLTCVFLARFYGKLTIIKLLTTILTVGVLILLVAQFKEYFPDSMRIIFDLSAYSESADRSSLQDRMVAINTGLIALREFPFVGYGIGNLVYHPMNVHGQVSHNTYVEILAETGFFGLFLYFLVFFCLYRDRKHLAKCCCDPPSRSMGAFMLIATFSLMSLTLVTYYSRILFFVFAVIYLDGRQCNITSDNQNNVV